MDNAFAYMLNKTHGDDTEAAYPYRGVDGKCKFKSSAIGSSISGCVLRVCCVFAVFLRVRVLLCVFVLVRALPLDPAYLGMCRVFVCLCRWVCRAHTHVRVYLVHAHDTQHRAHTLHTSTREQHTTQNPPAHTKRTHEHRYKDVAADDEAALHDAVGTVGPVSVAIHAGPLLQFYFRGVFNGVFGMPLPTVCMRARVRVHARTHTCIHTYARIHMRSAPWSRFPNRYL